MLGIYLSIITSQNIGVIPSYIIGATVVAKVHAGVITSILFLLSLSICKFNEHSANKFADDPELTNNAYFLSNILAI